MSPSLQRLKDLVEDLIQKLSESDTTLDQRHFRLLVNLSSVEKQALAKVATEWNWNVGSPTVMKFLQKTHILSMTDVIVNKFNKDPESAQLIFNDLLETEFMLLGDLLRHVNSTDPTGLALCDLLNEGFKRLCNDIIENPGILALNYLEEVEEYVHDDSFEEIRLMHLKLMLQEGPKYSLADSFSNQSTWNVEITNEHAVFKSFLTWIVGRDFPTRRKSFQTVLDRCDEWETQSWKYVMLLLRMVVNVGEIDNFGQDEQNDFRAMAKKFLKDTLRSSIDEEDENGLFMLFLVARQITQYNETLLGNYATWFKDTIGEMKYFLKANEFTTTMHSLAGMVQMESNADYLDVHISTYMPAPPRCNQLVLNYKQLCTSRQLHLRSLKDASTKQATVIEEDVFDD